MTDIIRIAFVLILLSLAFACYFLVVNALFNRRVLKTINIAKQLPGRSFGIGFVNFLFFGAIAVALFAVSEGVENGFVKVITLIPALAIAAVLVILLSLGLSAMVNVLGERIFPDFSTWKKSFWATIVLTFASAIPTAGWFLLFPFISLTGIGAVILGFFQRES